MIFGNGLKKFDFARQNLDGRAKCLAQKNEKKTLVVIVVIVKLSSEGRIIPDIMFLNRFFQYSLTVVRNIKLTSIEICQRNFHMNKVKTTLFSYPPKLL